MTFEDFAKTHALTSNICAKSPFHTETALLKQNLVLSSEMKELAKKLEKGGHSRNHTLESEVTSTLSDLLKTIESDIHTISIANDDWKSISATYSKTNEKVQLINQLIKLKKHSLHFIKILCDKNNLAFIPLEYACFKPKAYDYFDSKSIFYRQIAPWGSTKPKLTAYILTDINNVSIKNIYDELMLNKCLPMYLGNATSIVGAFMESCDALQYAVSDKDVQNQIRAIQDFLSSSFPSISKEDGVEILGTWLVNQKNHKIHDGLVYIPNSITQCYLKNHLYKKHNLDLEYNRELEPKQSFISVKSKSESTKEFTLPKSKATATLRSGIRDNINKSICIK